MQRNGRIYFVVSAQASAAAALMQRRFDDGATTEILRERAVYGHGSKRIIARPEVKEPEVPSGSFAYFSSYWEK